MKYYFNRIINNKLKLGVILLIFAYPLIDILLILLDTQRGGSALNPDLATFLSSTIYNGAQILLLWYLPLYLLLVVADDCIEDFKIGYKNILFTKWGKKKYFGINMLKSFVLCFAVIFIPLILNLIMTKIAFSGGTFTVYSLADIERMANLKSSLENGVITNITYIFVAAFVSGIVGMGAAAMSIALHNRFLVYPIVFLMWYIPSSVRQSIILALQPFTEYSLFSVMPTVGIVVGINCAAILFSFIKVMKYDKV